MIQDPTIYIHFSFRWNYKCVLLPLAFCLFEKESHFFSQADFSLSSSMHPLPSFFDCKFVYLCLPCFVTIPSMVEFPSSYTLSQPDHISMSSCLFLGCVEQQKGSLDAHNLKQLISHFLYSFCL
jgi:hypothetical protein